MRTANGSRLEERTRRARTARDRTRAISSGCASTPPRTISSSVCVTLFTEPGVVQQHAPSGAGAAAPAGASRNGSENPGRVVAAGHAVLVGADAHQARVLDRLDRTERHVRRALGASRLVDQVVRDQARRRNRGLPLEVEVIQRAIDQIDRGAAGDLGVGLDVGDEQLDGAEVRRDRVRQARRQVRRKQARVLRAGRVDDDVRRGDLRGQPRIERQRRAPRARAPATAASAPRAVERPRVRFASAARSIRKMLLIVFWRRASTIASSLRRSRPDASRATRWASRPSVTFSIRPAGKPDAGAQYSSTARLKSRPARR